MSPSRILLPLLVLLSGMHLPLRANTDKSLVAWVIVADINSRGGSVLTLQADDEFDAIVFGEKEPGKWMAGSEFFRRTQKDPWTNPAENADDKTLVQMAIVYQGRQITLYRDGQSIASYQATNIDLPGRKDVVAVFGLRHVGAGGNRFFKGAIEDARIYAQALTPAQIGALKPNLASEIKPWAWWDFEGEAVKDRAGRFAHAALSGGAKLAGGRLVLGDKAVMVAGADADAVNLAARSNIVPIPYVEETPAIPQPFPEDWLTIHLAHPGPGRGHPGDPNCAFHYKGLYHLHYIYRNRWGFAFAHVSSKDMVTWKWHPTKLVPPFTGHGMFSGTGFLTKDGKPAIIYHGEGSGRNQLAFATDDLLDQWTRPRAMIVKTPDGKDAAIRHWDPDCWLDGDTYYAICGGKPPLLMKSADLSEWTYLGELLHKDFPPNLGVHRNEDISCANMFRLGGKWMLLCISHDLGCRYYLGDFTDGKYLPESHATMNWARRDVFAPESLLTPDGRRVMWAWCLFPEKQTPARQTAIQTLPRELSLPEDGVLRIKPLKELEKLRYDPQVHRDLSIPAGGRLPLAPTPGDAVELNLTFRGPIPGDCGVTVLGDDKGKGFDIAFAPKAGKLLLGDIKPPLALAPGEDLNLRIFLDKGMVEVFANDRQAAVFLAPFDARKTGISLFSRGAALRADAQSWRLRSIYQEPR